MGDSYIQVYSNVIEYKDKVLKMKNFLNPEGKSWVRLILEDEFKSEQPSSIYSDSSRIYVPVIGQIFYVTKTMKKFYLVFKTRNRYSYTTFGPILIEENTLTRTFNIYCLQSLLCEKLGPYLDVENLKYGETLAKTKDFEGIQSYCFSEAKTPSQHINYLNSLSVYTIYYCDDTKDETLTTINCSDGEVLAYKFHLKELQSKFLFDQEYENVYVDLKIEEIINLVKYSQNRIPVTQKISDHLKYLDSELYYLSVRQLVKVFFEELN